MSGRLRRRDASGDAARALAVVAGALTLYQVTRPGLLFGATPDVAVYLGAAVRLVHGAVPYRDFVFVQPPGFVLLTTPVAALSDLTGTRVALAVLRLTTPLLAASSVLLVGALVRHRGLAATLVACTVMAVFPAQLYAIRGPQLEPVAVFLLLLGAVTVFNGDSLVGSRRQVGGGAALGAAVAVKLSAAIPVAALLLVCVWVVRRRAAATATAATAVFGLLAAPFVAMAPGAFWHDAVATQLGRVPGGGRAPLLTRLGEMTGVSEIGAPPAAAIAVAAALTGIVLIAFVATRRRPTPLEWFALAATAAVVIAQLAPAQYYTQYAALLAPFVSVLLGLSAARLVGRRFRARAAAATVGVACAVLVVAQLLYVSGEAAPDYAASIDAVLPPGACALSDSPVLLVTANRFQAAAPGCTLMTDPAGTALAQPSSSAAAMATWRRAFEHVEYVVTDQPITRWSLPPGAEIPRYVAALFRMTRAGPLLIYVRVLPLGAG